MSQQPSQILVSVAHSFTASGVPPEVIRELESRPVEANLILPILCQSQAASPTTENPQNRQCWIWASVQGRIVLVFSLTRTYMGTNYPAFLFTPLNQGDQLYTQPTMQVAVQGIVDRVLFLKAHIPATRIYSCFGRWQVSSLFAQAWSARTGVRIVDKPYYDALLTSLRTDIDLRHWLAYPIQPPANQPLANISMGPAQEIDVRAIGDMCYSFTTDPGPNIFGMTPQQAYNEAACLLQRGEVWMARDDLKGRIACIVAFTRNTDRVATITKVYTHPEYRGGGLAENLVRRVCLYLLNQHPTRQTVALFVGLTNRAANVYSRVGFVGVGEHPIQDASAPPVERYTEYGFNPAVVQMGLW